MKKITVILSVLAAVFIFASCNDVLKEVAPKDTWIAESIHYKIGNDTISLMCYLYYSDSGTTTRNESDINPGLTIVVRASTDAGAAKLFGSGITAEKYIIKTFSKNATETVESVPVTINDTLWGVLGLVRNFSNKTTGTPECLTQAGYARFTGSFTDANWNKILAQIITANVLDKL